MKLLLDANLSWRLSKSLVSKGIESLHVDFIDGLKKPAKDIDIWKYAFKNNCIIITNDEDFINLALFKGYPPKILILKIGNQSSRFPKNVIVSQSSKIRDFYDQNEYGILEIF
jgi:predicted nuclease of predicted toxin-antitoxin system